MVGLDVRCELLGWATDGVLIVENDWRKDHRWAVDAIVPRSLAEELDICEEVELAVSLGDTTSNGIGYVEEVNPLVATARVHISGTSELTPWPLDR